MQLKTGQRLASTVCGAEVMVITAPEDDTNLTCGGAPMADTGSTAEKGEIDPDYKESVQIGKRYVDADAALELLCIKPGEGSLAIAGTPLLLKEAKKLPKTD